MLFAPQKFAQALFSISLGIIVLPRRNEKQSYEKFEGQIRYIIPDVANFNCYADSEESEDKKRGKNVVDHCPQKSLILLVLSLFSYSFSKTGQ